MKKLLSLLVLFSANTFATPVNINTADAQTIADSLEGIGLAKAEAIVKYRTEKGEFKKVEDLDNVSGIGAKTLERIRADILLSNSPQPPEKSATKPVATSKPADH